METKAGWRLRPSQVLWKLSDRVRQSRERKSMDASAALGREGEDLAHRYLQRAGYAVVTRNFRAGTDSEIDLVARKEELVIFVEVKTRRSLEYGAPERAIDAKKMKKIVRAASAYLTRAGLDWSQARFDVIAIVPGDPPSVQHHEDAFYPRRWRT